MELAKQHMDIGLYTNNREDMLRFWQEDVGLQFDHLGKLGGGVQQLRHFLGEGPTGPILKINHARDPLPHAPASGYHEILLARNSCQAPESLTDPDGNRLCLVPPGYLGISGIGIKMNVRSLEKFDDFYGRILELPTVPEAGPHAYACGQSVVIGTESTKAPEDAVQKAQGYRYLTFQIFQADNDYKTIISRGGGAGQEPITLGTTVRFGFIRDPDGNWIELSQRATLTGSLD
ncbi:MAG: VOC family protein [Proteobacteria bacterium]|nr:VOC family protein [Pseudomonadota bacterium]